VDLVSGSKIVCYFCMCYCLLLLFIHCMHIPCSVATTDVYGTLVRRIVYPQNPLNSSLNRSGTFSVSECNFEHSRKFNWVWRDNSLTVRPGPCGGHLYLILAHFLFSAFGFLLSIIRPPRFAGVRVPETPVIGVGPMVNPPP